MALGTWLAPKQGLPKLGMPWIRLSVWRLPPGPLAPIRSHDLVEPFSPAAQSSSVENGCCPAALLAP